jgi:hypothetical protein
MLARNPGAEVACALRFSVLWRSHQREPGTSMCDQVIMKLLQFARELIGPPITVHVCANYAPEHAKVIPSLLMESAKK